MDLTKGKISSLYFKYLAAAFGSALISSIYGMADTAMVGHYQGPNGSAAMAVVAPIWNLVYSLGLLTGLGGSVLLSNERGKKSGKDNHYFTVAFFLTVAISLICWAVVLIFDKELLILFGADEEILPIALNYITPIKFGIPLFIFSQTLAAFLRNDGNPQLATIAVLCGGVFNIVGDYFCIFSLDLGAFGAGLATTIGCLISCAVMASHFFTKKCSLKFVKPSRSLNLSRQIFVIGFPSFFVDVAMGILTTLFNRQIVLYLNNDALAVYGIIANLVTVIQCCAYSVGQSAQPLFSVNFGAGLTGRVKETLKYAIFATIFFTVVWLAVFMFIPNGIINLFMNATDDVLKIAPAIMRVYAISFVLMPFNVFSTYYFQSLLKSKASFIVSIMRGMVLSGILIYVLPAVFNADAIWFAMPITELVTAIVIIILMVKYTKKMPSSVKAS